MPIGTETNPLKQTTLFLTLLVCELQGPYDASTDTYHWCTYLRKYL